MCCCDEIDDNLQFPPDTRVHYYQHGRFIGTGVIIDYGTKNCYRVYDVRLDSGENYWGYADQFKEAE